MQIKTRQIIRQLAIKHNLEEQVVEQILRSCYELVRKEITEIDRSDVSNFKTIMIPGWGKLIPNTKKIYYIHKKQREKDANNNQSTIDQSIQV